MSRQTIRISMIQSNPVAGDIGRNLDEAVATLRAEAGSADLIIFSECFLTGYPVNDLMLRPGFVARSEAALTALRAEVVAVGGPAVLIGAPAQSDGQPWNAAFLIEPSGVTRMARKVELPNSDVFDERRTFSSAERATAPFNIMGFRLGVQICEDMWHGRVSRELADELADVLIVINGSPYEGGKHALRVRHASERVRATGLPLIYVNQVGGQDELVFDGASFFMNAEGSVVMGKAFAPDVLRAVLRRDADGRAHLEMSESFAGRAPETYPSDRVATDYEACVTGLRDYVAKTGAPHVFVGVSGGLDSAVVLAMAVDAIGPSRVVGVMMPSSHTGEESLSLADDLMSRLGVHKRTVRIDEQVAATEAALAQIGEGLSGPLGVAPAFGIARENYQARLRGVCLMGLSNILGGIVLSTGNKSEMAVGYATLYGDMAGGFNPLKSAYKTRVFEMARWRNRDVEVIPDGIITRPPSAELADGQTDEASLGSYEILDATLASIIEGKAGVAATVAAMRARFGERTSLLIGAHGSLEAYVSKVAGMVRKAQYKRAQAAPGVKLNVTDFGPGWRYPIAGNYEL